MLREPRGRDRSAFTLVELMVVIAMIAILAAIAIPRLISAKVTANEGMAIATLRAILAAEAETQSRAAIDTDGDGAGEFGYLAELCATQPARISVGGVPGPGVAGVDELEPSSLSPTLGNVKLTAGERAGYYFRIFLPDSAFGSPAGIPEDPNGGKLAAPFPDPDGSEVAFCAYAWPVDHEGSGRSAFFVNQEGTLLQTANRGAGAYSGTTRMPDFDAAYTAPGDMGVPIAVSAIGADGNLWVPVQ